MAAQVIARSPEPTQDDIDDLIAEAESLTEHTHRYVILVGAAPITMMAGSYVSQFKACACGDQIYAGSYLYDPIHG